MHTAPRGGDDEAGTTGEARERLLVRIMADLAGGDTAAVFTLRDRFEPELAGSVRRVAAARGARLSADDVEALVTDVAIDLGARAGSWDPALGVPPWVWARLRVANLVDAHVGQWTRPLEALDGDRHPATAAAPHPAAAPAAAAEDDTREPAPSPGAEPPTLDLLDRLSRRDRRVALLCEAVGRVASPRDQVIFFETELQASLGDRSPAVTVGAMVGLRPDAVRQQHRRVRTRLRALVDGDPRFAELAGLPVVAA